MSPAERDVRRKRRFAETSFLFGGNAAYIEQLYAQYEADPASVDPDWREFFAGLNDDDRAVADQRRRAPPGSAQLAISPHGELVAALDGQWPVSEKALGDKIKAKPRWTAGRDPAADVRRATRIRSAP